MPEKIVTVTDPSSVGRRLSEILTQVLTDRHRARRKPPAARRCPAEYPLDERAFEAVRMLVEAANDIFHQVSKPGPQCDWLARHGPRDAKGGLDIIRVDIRDNVAGNQVILDVRQYRALIGALVHCDICLGIKRGIQSRLHARNHEPGTRSSEPGTRIQQPAGNPNG